MEALLNSRRIRILTLFCVFLVSSLLLLVDGLHTLSSSRTGGTSLLFTWVQFGTSAFMALLFLSVGTLVWLYARLRSVAFLLLGFSFCMAATFAVQTSASSNDPLFSAIGQGCAALSFPFLFLLLLRFPKNHLQHPLHPSRQQRTRRWLLQGYSLAVFLLSVLVAFFAILRYVSPAFPHWASTVVLLYYIVALCGILGAILASYRQASSHQEQQQLRIFVGGIILAFTPFLLLTVLPLILHLPAQYVISGQLSTLTFCLIPTSTGYSILRFQLFVLDTYVRRIISSIVGFVGLALLCYLTIALGSLLLSGNISLYVACVAVCLTFLAPSVWQRAKIVSDTLFFPDIKHYRHLLEQPVALSHEKLTLENAAQLVALAGINTLETPQACVFVLNREGTTYESCPPLRHDDPNDSHRRGLLQKVMNALVRQGDMSNDVLDIPQGSLHRLKTTSRPLLLSEMDSEEEAAQGIAHYMGVASSGAGATILFAPVIVQGKMIAFLVLGERANQQQYAGPEFGVVQLLLDRFAAVVETAYLTRELHASNVQLLTKNGQLLEAYEHQKELDILKDEFITIASHELRTPLTAIQGYVALLSEYNGDDELLPPQIRAEFLAKADRGCEELTLLIGNMTTAGDVEKDTQKMTISTVSLCDTVIKVTDILDSLLQKERHRVRVTIEEGIFVEVDEQRLGQVLRNLIANAIKYSSEGSPIEISAVQDEQNQRIIVSVRDYGKGVPLDDQPRLFGRFVRLERDMNSPTRGSGLGLYITKKLVEAMHGTIWIESTGVEGEGSAFRFTLPHVNASQTTPSQKQIREGVHH